MARRWSNREIEQLERYLVDGMLYKDIALKLNRTVPSIKSMSKYLGFNREVRWSNDERDDVINKFNEGMLTKQIAAMYNTSGANIRMILYNARKKGLVGYRYVNRSVSAIEHKNRKSDK